MRTLNLIILLLLFGSTVFAQQGRHSVSFGGRIGDPLGEFDAAWDRRAEGFGANILMPMKRIPLSFGLQFDKAGMGGEKNSVPVEQAYVQATEGTLSVRANTYGHHALIRLDPIKGRFVPYVDGLAGWRTFTMRSKLRVDGVDGVLTRERLERDAAFSYGWAAGLMVRLIGPLYAEGRVERMYGGEATFAVPTSITISDQGMVDHETRTAKTDLLFFHLGIGLRF